MPLLDLGFNSKKERMNQDLERLPYNQEHGIHTSYTGIRALKNSDVFTAVRIISADVASTQLKNKGNESNTVMEDVLSLFNNNPGNGLPGWHFKFIIIADMLLNGNSYVQILRDKNGFVNGFYFLQNDLVSVEQISDEKTGANNDIIYNVSEDVTGKAARLNPEDILDFRYITLDGIMGLSALYSLSYEIGISQGSKSFLRNFFDNGGTSTS
ncbi:MAG: phage portal protein, partial [Leuconostoc sp.]|nr:phage portal protein [Leuconostoc sp.]